MNTNKLKIFNDPVHGFISIPNELIFDLIEHPYFQRLRRISQTGLTHFVYPGAIHTRFHHALGAMHLMQLALQTLRNKSIEISTEEYNAACIAILLHDIGHGPFSHALESTLMDEMHHEKVSVTIISLLNEEFDGALDLAIQMFLGKYKRSFFNQLISSQVDVDRLDYLKRDSFFTGVSEGNINSERIITMMNVRSDELVFDVKGIYSIEKYLISRMFMYWQVYFHKTSLAAETILIKILKRAKELYQNNIPIQATESLLYFISKRNFKNLSKEDLQHFTSLDDTDIISAIKSWQKHPDKILSTLCKNIIERNLPKSKFLNIKLTTDELNLLIIKIEKEYSIEDGTYFVHQQKVSVLPYQTNKQPINLLAKNGEIIQLIHSEGQILSKHLSEEKSKYHLILPK